MATWRVRADGQKVIVNYQNDSQSFVDVGQPAPGVDVQCLLAWVAGELRPGDTATLNGKTVMQMLRPAQE